MYHDEQKKYRNHWGIASTIPPEAAGVQVTPTSFVNVYEVDAHAHQQAAVRGRLWHLQPGIHRALSAERDWPDRQGVGRQRDPRSKVYNVVDSSNSRQANAWPNPADHFSVLRTFMGAASYVTGAHSFRGGGTLTNGDWRLLTRWTGDVQPITYTAGRPTSVTLRLPSDRQERRQGRPRRLFIQDKWAMGRITLEPRPALRPVHRRVARELDPRQPLHDRRDVRRSAPTARWIRATCARARCRTGRTSRRASASRWTCSATAARRSRRATRATSPARRSRSPTR